MSPYYVELLEEIQELMKQKSYLEANVILQRELAMPYVPTEVEVALRKYQRDVTYFLTDGKEEKEDSFETLLNRLKHGKPQGQLMAADALSKRNLRECIVEIKDYLNKDPIPEVAAILIDGLAQQQIQGEFTYTRGGLEYTFSGDSVTPIMESEGFLEALKRLEEDLQKEPSLLQMARTLLIHKAYLYLPLSYSSQEAEMLCEEVKKELNEIWEGN